MGEPAAGPVRPHSKNKQASRLTQRTQQINNSKQKGPVRPHNKQQQTNTITYKHTTHMRTHNNQKDPSVRTLVFANTPDACLATTTTTTTTTHNHNNKHSNP